MKYLVGPLTDRILVKQKICQEIDEAEELLEVTVKPAKNTRSLRQNAMQFKWYQDAELQGDMTSQEYRALCKLTIGVPILRDEDEDFRLVYDEVIRPLDYESKLKIMMEPIDLPVTSRMTVKQNSKFLDRVHQFFTIDLGFQMTDPAETK